MKKLAILGMLVAAGAAQADVLFDNGPVVGPYLRSVVSQPDTTYGFGAQSTAGNAVADNFTVTGNGWTVSDIDFYAYQTGAGAFSFTDVTWSIVSGDINAGTVLASGTTAVTNGGLVGYRVQGGSLLNLLNKDRAIFDVKADIADVALGAGTYWLTWSLTGSDAFSGPWVPPTQDFRAGDAQQAIAGGSFAGLVDDGSGDTVDLPFVLNGTVTAVPEPATVLSLAAGLALLAARRRRRD